MLETSGGVFQVALVVSTSFANACKIEITIIPELGYFHQNVEAYFDWDFL